jgi:hypothetical protein
MSTRLLKKRPRDTLQLFILAFPEPDISDDRIPPRKLLRSDSFMFAEHKAL